MMRWVWIRRKLSSLVRHCSHVSLLVKRNLIVFYLIVFTRHTNKRRSVPLETRNIQTDKNKKNYAQNNIRCAKVNANERFKWPFGRCKTVDAKQFDDFNLFKQQLVIREPASVVFFLGSSSICCFFKSRLFAGRQQSKLCIKSYLVIFKYSRTLEMDIIWQ